jgi:hypothetical protein
LQQRQEYHSRAVFWSPRKKREAEARDATNKRLAEEDKLQKSQMKQLKADNALYNKSLRRRGVWRLQQSKRSVRRRRQKRPLRSVNGGNGGESSSIMLREREAYVLN